MTDNSYGPTGDWLIATARRNPEALLVIAAGCALLLRKGSQLASASFSEAEDDEDASDGERRAASRHSLKDGIAGATEAATEYASEMTDRVYDTASSYASMAAGYAQEGGRTVSRQASRLSNNAQSAAGQVWREQPLAVAALGLAAGAALAAMLPPTEVEKRTFAPASDALAEAANRTMESVKEAAGEVAQRLQGGAAEIGAAGLREIARDAAETFAASVSGKSDEPGHNGGAR